MMIYIYYYKVFHDKHGCLPIGSHYIQIWWSHLICSTITVYMGGIHFIWGGGIKSNHKFTYNFLVNQQQQKKLYGKQMIIHD